MDEIETVSLTSMPINFKLRHYQNPTIVSAISTREGLPITSDLRFVHVTPAPILARLE
jgi:hypothetical protein